MRFLFSRLAPALLPVWLVACGTDSATPGEALEGGDAVANASPPAGDEGASKAPAVAPSGDTNPFLLIGVDGLEVSVLEDLWSQGKLPNLKKLCDEGICGKNIGEYSSSPIIWTTIATGMSAEKHGIESFTVKGDDGNLMPVSSTMRKVPAIWNMMSSVGRRIGVLGWWVTWPAEEINGAMFTARASKPDVDDRVYPPEVQKAFDEDIKTSTAAQDLFKSCDQFAPNDAWVGHYGKEMLDSGDYDLVMAYFRCIDVVSHQYWAFYEPEKFQNISEAEIKKWGDIIPANYEATDAMIGDLLETAGDDVNVILASDHGFFAQKKETVVVRVLMDRVFAYLGYSELVKDEPDLSKSQVYAYNSRPKRRMQIIRFAKAGRDPGGTVTEAQFEDIKTRLKADLKKFKYESGSSVFILREASESEAELGADFSVQVLRDQPSTTLYYDGKPVEKMIGVLTRQSGNHDKPIPPGVFMARGPDINPKAPIEDFRIQDFTPTLLYGMGLPVAEDFDGEVVKTVFTDDFNKEHPVQSIASWGSRDGTAASASQADDAMLDELRQLGYIE